MSPNEANRRITQMKVGPTHAERKAEHVVDLKSNLVLAAEINPVDHSDTDTLDAQQDVVANRLDEVICETYIEEVSADKTHRAPHTLEHCQWPALQAYKQMLPHAPCR